MYRRLPIAIALTLACLLAAPAWAAGSGEPVRIAQTGIAQTEKVPLSQIVEQIRSSGGGEAASIKFDEGVYRILWRYPDGKLQRFEADAATGDVRKVG
ncbi:PepSY domain-containing protein [Minwuia sp.]|uniref:PepSY domain-containing protein n=1 Tax=Minwuia sp. TaxID=2493630 RepID=UPI003A9085C2